jgi:hypothetical protein
MRAATATKPTTTTSTKLGLEIDASTGLTSATEAMIETGLPFGLTENQSPNYLQPIPSKLPKTSIEQIFKAHTNSTSASNSGLMQLNATLFELAQSKNFQEVISIDRQLYQQIRLDPFANHLAVHPFDERVNLQNSLHNSNRADQDANARQVPIFLLGSDDQCLGQLLGLSVCSSS